MNPQIFLRTLEENWPFISAIWQRFESRAFNEPDMYRMAKSFYQIDQIHSVVRKLTQTGILTEFRRGGSGFQFNNQVAPIIRFLLDEQNLGLIGEIGLNANELLEHLTAIEEALMEASRASFLDACSEMHSRFSILIRMCEQNRSAMYRLASEAKQSDTSSPLAVRYGKVIRAWEQYITPALKMREPHEPFDELLRRINRDINNWLLDDSIHLLAQDDLRIELEMLQLRLMDFKDALKKSIDDMASYLAPLVKFVRVNTDTARGASLCLQELSKYGKEFEKAYDLRLPGRKRLARKPEEELLAAFYTSFIDNETSEPDDKLDRERTLDAVTRREKRVHVHELVKWLRLQRPVHDVVHALKEHFPKADEMAVLSALGEFTLNEGTRRMVVRHDEEQVYPFENCVVRMKRRSLELHLQPPRKAPSADLDFKIPG